LNEGNSSFSNKESDPLQRGDNPKNVKMGRGHLKIFFSRTTGPILSRFITNHPWGKVIQVCSNKGGVLSSSGDNSGRVKLL
jgi:hypothetical protein